MTAIAVLVACGGEPAVEVHAGDERLRTDPSKYPAAPTDVPTLPDGYHGLVKVSAEHGFTHGDKAKTTSFVAEGAGGLWVRSGDWYVVTARHVVVPNPDTQQVGDTVLGKLAALDTDVRVSSLGIEPVALRVLVDEDVAALRIASSDRRALKEVLALDASAPLHAATAGVRNGDTIEAWGFPSTHHPQVDTPVVSFVDAKVVILNAALLRGYSGGPVVSRASGTRVVAGLVSRADEAARQTTVIPWATVERVFGADATELAIPGSGTFAGLPLQVGDAVAAAPAP